MEQVHQPARGAVRRALAGAAALATLAAAPRADAQVVHPDVTRYAAEARAAKGAELVAPLRALWGTWDLVDPDQVEAALEGISKAAAPAERGYVDLVRAYGRRRRGDLDGARAMVGKLGFVGRFITIGPFDDENRTGLARDHGPERDLSPREVLERSHPGKERAVRWRVPPTELAPLGWVDVGAYTRPTERICSYALAWLRAKPGGRADRKLTLRVGASGGLRVFWNGERVLEDAGYRDFDVDRFAVTVKLQKGSNALLVKTCDDQQAPRFSVRLTDEKGAPDLDVEVSADPASAEKDFVRWEAKKGSTQVVKGPRGLLEELRDKAQAKGAKPPALEAYARYLASTGGDPAPLHVARDFATRAAEGEPTRERLLLAAALAEDRNQRRAWLDKAARLVGVSPENPGAAPAETKDARGRTDVLLAYARLEASGPAPRAALPILSRVLALDPNELGATLQYVQIYQDAGLPRTALATLEQAMERHPRAAALIRQHAGLLRALGRDLESTEAAARLLGLRFDDETTLRELIDLARARRDVAGAERWIDRFLAVAGSREWGLAVAARAYQGLGQRDRALATFQRALAICPDDVETMRAVADLHGERGDREKQLATLRGILALKPQLKDVREYLEQAEPPKPRPDEAWAWSSEKFLKLRGDPPKNAQRRTLRNLTVTTVFENGLSSKFRQVVFQPLTDEAAAQAREFAFAYQGDSQIVTIRAAKVYRANGKVDESFEEGSVGVANPAIAMYTSTRTYYVHFPRLEPGDVVEVRYRVEDVASRNEIADYFGEIEYLQDDVPITSSEYVLVHPKSRTFHSHVTLAGVEKETKDDGAGRVVERWTAKDVPPVLSEPGMPPYAEVLGSVHVSTFKTWEDVGAWYGGLAKDQLDVDDEVRKKLKELTKNLKDDKAKVKAVYKFATDLRYVALEFGIEGIRPRRCALTIARGWGDCKDKATVIVAMLKEVGVAASIVLVRTGMRGDFPADVASLAPFDHAIAYVPSLDLYLDGTAEHAGSGELPAMDRGALALVVDPTGAAKSKLVHLPDPPASQSLAKRRIEVTASLDGSATFSWELAVTGVHAAEWRQRYLADGTRRERASRDVSNELGAVELAAGKGGLDVNDLSDVEQPVRLKAKGKATAFGRKEGEQVSLPAGPRVSLSDLAALSSRRLDVVLHGRTTREDEWVITLPPGTRIVRVPLPHELDGPLGALSVKVDQAGNKVTVRTKLELKRSRIPASEYAAWRTFTEQVDRWFGQRLVISK